MPEKYRSDDPDGSCLAYVPFKRHLIWEDCSRYYRGLCHDDGGKQTPRIYFGTWLQMMNECLRNGTYPVGPFFNFESVPPEGEVYWLGAIKSFSIFPGSSDKTYNEQSAQQGYIDKNKSLRFEQKNHTLRALCVKGSTVSSTTPESLPVSDGTTHSSLQIHSAASSVRQSTPSSIVISSAASRPTADGSEEKANRAGEKDGPNLVAVYVVVPLALVVLFVVLLAVFIRRKSIPCHDKSEQSPDYVNATPSIDPRDAPNHNSYETTVHVNNIDHHYSALDHVNANEAAVYENDDKEYENTQSKYENVYELK